MNHDQRMSILQHMMLGRVTGERWRKGIPWRNHYTACAEDQRHLDALEADGLIIGRPYPLDGYPEARMYHATTAGIRAWIRWRNEAGFGPRLYRPANSEDGESFVYQYCDRCRRDAEHRRNHDESGCEILARTMYRDTEDPDYPVEWLQSEDGAVCTAFEYDGGSQP